MSLLALVSAAFAAPVQGYWHPADLVAESKRFAEANRAAGGAYEAAARGSVALARALNDYREALDLLGGAAPPLEYERLDILEQSFHRQHAVAQAFADTLIEDFDHVFSAARERAVADLGATVVTCEREIPDGPRVPGMRPRTRKNPECVGADLNAAIAAKMDEDPVLDTALAEILAIPWPTTQLPVEAMRLEGDAGQFIDVHTLFRTGAGVALGRIARDDDDARMPFEAAIEAGADVAALKTQVDAARQITLATAAKRAALAAPVLDAARASLTKSRAPATGWCAQPAILGGCVGEDVTEAMVPKLLADKKVAKAIE